MDASESNNLNPDNQEIKRNPDGTWPAGQSGNPAGMPPKRYTRANMVETATRLLQKYTVRELVKLYKNTDALQDLSVEEAAILSRMVGMIQRDGGKEFDRFFNQLIGKPVQTTELTGKDGEQLFNNDDARQSIRSKLLPETAGK